LRGELVRRGDQRQAGELGQLGRDLLSETAGGVESGPHGGASRGQLMAARHGLVQPVLGFAQLGGPSRPFLTDGQRGGVLQVGAADFDHVNPLHGLGPDRLGELVKARQRVPTNREQGGDVHGGGEAVVGRLAHVDVVVGVYRVFGAQLAAQQLASSVGDHLVDVHVGLGARAGLPDIQRKLAVELAGDDLIGRGDDGLREGAVQAPGLGVDLGCGFLT
jgi:hypothetical protein